MTTYPIIQIAREPSEGSVINAASPNFVKVGDDFTEATAEGLGIDYDKESIEALQGCAKRIHEIIDGIDQGNKSTMQTTISLINGGQVAVIFNHEGVRAGHEKSQSTGYMMGYLKALADSRPSHCSAALDMNDPHAKIYFRSLGDLVVALNAGIGKKEAKIPMPYSTLPNLGF